MSVGMCSSTATTSASVELPFPLSECHVCAGVAPHIGVHSERAINEPMVLIEVIGFDGKMQEHRPSNIFDRLS